MICTLHGVLVEAGVKEVKDNQTGLAINKPFITIYSEGSTQTILDCKADGKKIGDQIDINVSIRLREWEGRRYLSVKPIN